MKILIVGTGKGSWTMRGLQLGAAMGARMTETPTAADLTWCDAVVLVKKIAPAYAPVAHAAGKPVVWDALDFWSQPTENSLSHHDAHRLLRTRVQQVKPALTIGATRAMAAACEGAYLPHHSWKGLVPTPARERVNIVAYEGNAVYLGRWHNWVATECARRGWRFLVNPPSLAPVDILVSFRDGPWDGWICREWKSGVKVVNALAAGRPLIAQDSAARREIGVMGSTIERPQELSEQLDWWSDYERRQQVVAAASNRAAQYSVDAVATQYLQLLTERGVTCRA